MEDAICGGVVKLDYNKNKLFFDFVALFAVDEHNKKQNSSKLQFVKGVEAKDQIVTGTMYYITLEAKAKDGSEKQNTYEAKVWYKLNHSLELIEFKQLVDVASSA